VRKLPRKPDLRIMKTHKALIDALPTLLGRQNFADLTVNSLCNEALVSRATFYSHFNDKYDLLEYWLTYSEQKNMNKYNTCEQMEMMVNQFIKKNKIIITNLVDNANSETLKILCKHLLSILDISVEKNENGGIDPKNIILANFCSGGLIYYLTWQIENKFPPDVQMMNTYFLNIMQYLLKWEPIQDINTD